MFPVVLNKRLNDQILKREIAEALSDPKIPARIHYDEIVEKGLDAIETLLSSKNDARARWISLKLIEGDIEVSQQISDETRPAVEKIVQGICKHRGQQGTAVIADDRFGYIRGLLKDVVRRRNVSQHTFSDRLDKITLNSILGLPVFFFVMYLVFLVAVRLSQPIIDLIDAGFSWLLVDGIPALLDRALVPQWLTFLLSEGLGGGITTIATFIPPIFFIFFSLSILEDSGYMARAAFIADKFMRRIGLPGKAFIPLLVGFGCTVPAIMATRTLESKRDRVFASLLTPFVSCGAKLPVYTFMGLMFFPDKADLVIFSLYLSGILMAMLTGLLLKRTIFRTEPGDFVMELPPYHVPTCRGIFLHTWHRLKDFILRAGKTILLAIILINVLKVVQIKDPFTPGGQKITILELGGKALNPVFRPMGINKDNWQASVALVSGIFAKEAVVGTMQSLYIEEGVELKSTVTRAFGGWEAAYAYLLFVLLYSPCVAALTMLFKEHGRTWLFFSLIYLTILAWLIATLFYQISTFRIQSLLWIGFSALLGIAMYQYLKLIGRGSRNAFE
ncbi:MAG: ferrous iron transport protein B [Candidatus Cloacimonetes bacterium]|nr:ferrous iron transport protein B [Candidatus Cloacimonadota bacterium]